MNTKGLSVIVCGGRDYTDIFTITSELNRFHAERPIKNLWHGNARGVDTIAGHWGAMASGVYVHPVSAQWHIHGNRAGPLRNQRMIDDGKPDVVIAFPGGRGTADMVARAKKAGVEVVEIETNAKD